MKLPPVIENRPKLVFTGLVVAVAALLAVAISGLAKKSPIGACTATYSEDAKLRKGKELTDVARDQVREICECAYHRIDDPSHLSLIADAEPGDTFSNKPVANVVRALGACALEIGLGAASRRKSG